MSNYFSDDYVKKVQEELIASAAVIRRVCPFAIGHKDIDNVVVVIAQLQGERNKAKAQLTEAVGLIDKSRSVYASFGYHDNEWNKKCSEFLEKVKP